MHAHAVTPILNVADLQASFRWFERFGWRKLWDHGEPPTFGAVGSWHCEIFLCQDGQGGRDRGAGGPDQGVWMSIWVDDVDRVHRECVEEGLDVLQPPTDEPWGVRELHVRHPDGHVFRVSGREQPHDHPHPHEHEHDHDHPHDH